MLNFIDGRSFTVGACSYFDRHPADLTHLPRVVLFVWVSDVRVTTIVDTGGAYFICSPDSAELTGLTRAEPIGADDLIIRGYRCHGDLYRTSIQFVAAKGESLNVDVTAFVPRLLPGEEWHFPSFLGLQGCLEFIRFAVDPVSNAFFFGPLT
jgi:hypothetical protein